MKLLVVTQTIDKSDAVLGFFHEWLAALAPNFDSIEVICLEEGKHTLPGNIRVHSLGKEKRIQEKKDIMIYHNVFVRVGYVLRLLRYVWKLRSSYDAVFVHMNPEHVILGGWWWKLWGKKIYLWYNHPKAGLRLSLAMMFADKVFHTSPYAASAGSKKSIRMPAGIDTERFVSKGETREKYNIYLQGRVMPSKRVNTACEAVELLLSRGIPATLSVVGPDDTPYGRELKHRYGKHIEAGTIQFLGPRQNHETPALYSAHGVALNLASGGHYDKTVLEAMACETPVIVTSTAFTGRVPEEWAGKQTPLEFADALEAFFLLPETKRSELGKKEREAVIVHESLTALMHRLKEEIT